MMTNLRVLVATDLGASSDGALLRAHAYALALGAELVVCHVVPDARKSNPLFPERNEVDLLQGTGMIARAGVLVGEQLARLAIPDETRVAIESGSPEEEIVRLAEDEHATLIVLGASLRHTNERPGRVAERVVRYAHASVLIVRKGPTTGRILVATDLSTSSEPAHAVGGLLVKAALEEATLLHVMEQQPALSATAAMSALGCPWLPPPASVIDELQELRLATLQGIAAQHGFTSVEQFDGDPATIIVERSAAISAEMIILGSRGRTRLRRMLLGSVAEAVVRRSECSVLVAREGA